jgi:hypothetical protein
VFDSLSARIENTTQYHWLINLLSLTHNFIYAFKAPGAAPLPPQPYPYPQQPYPYPQQHQYPPQYAPQMAPMRSYVPRQPYVVNASMAPPQYGRPMPMHTQQAAPVMPPKEKKTLTITDKQGNVIDLKTGKPVSEAEVDVEGATTKMSSLHVAKTDAGSSLRKAAEEAIKAGGAKKLKEEAERKKLEEEEEAKKKAEEEAAVSGFTLLLVCLQ